MRAVVLLAVSCVAYGQYPTAQRYVDRLGARLAAQSPETVRFSFRVVAGQSGSFTHEPQVQAGGAILVPINLLLAAQDEDELAGMLAHSIAHVAAGHEARKRMVFGSSFGTREHWQADKEAVRLLTAAGFDASALARYNERTNRWPASDPGRPTLTRRERE